MNPMSTGFQIKDQMAAHFLTFQVVDWIDVFTRKIYKEIIVDRFQYSMENKSLQIFAYVIMSNHIHLIANSTDGRLSDTIRDIKKFTSKKIIEAIDNIPDSRREWMLNRFKFNASHHKSNKYYQVWTHENHAVYLYSNEFLKEKIEYIHNNPVRAGIVEKPEDYLYSSARNYASLEAPLNVALLVLPVHTYR
jgi:REP element-mobilizing transposase RayT